MNEKTVAVVDELTNTCHGAAFAAGWWNNKVVGDLRAILRNPQDAMQKFIARMVFSNKLALIHSEASESLEGDRKSLPDDKLPQYPMAIVELADVLIRTCDTAGAAIAEDAGYTFGEVVAAKLAFNAQRPDHKPENREAAGGKIY